MATKWSGVWKKKGMHWSAEHGPMQINERKRNTNFERNSTTQYIYNQIKIELAIANDVMWCDENHHQLHYLPLKRLNCLSQVYIIRWSKICAKKSSDECNFWSPERCCGFSTLAELRLNFLVSGKHLNTRCVCGFTFTWNLCCRRTVPFIPKHYSIYVTRFPATNTMHQTNLHAKRFRIQNRTSGNMLKYFTRFSEWKIVVAVCGKIFAILRNIFTSSICR